MLRKRIIVSLLVLNNRVVKTTNFSDPIYVGDPINTVKIFNEKEVDEIMISDIGATNNKQDPNFDLIRSIAEQANMPVCYGGGISEIHQIEKIISLGIEKVSISSAIFSNKYLILEAAKKFGSQSIVAVLNIKKDKENYSVFVNGKRSNTGEDPVDLAKTLSSQGIGEIVINSIDLDGCRTGYDTEIARILSNELSVPLTVLGGCGSIDHMKDLSRISNPSGIAVGSFFIFKGKYKAVLINYLNKEEKYEISDS